MLVLENFPHQEFSISNSTLYHLMFLLVFPNLMYFEIRIISLYSFSYNSPDALHHTLVIRNEV